MNPTRRKRTTAPRPASTPTFSNARVSGKRAIRLRYDACGSGLVCPGAN
jgi:hypothetical protein